VSDTATVARLLVEQREEDERTIADLALVGERAACGARLGLMLMLGVTSALTPLFGGNAVPDPLQFAAVVVYVAYTAGFWIALRRAKPSVRKGLIIPFVMMPVDYLFAFTIAWRVSSVSEGHTPILPALMLGLFVCFNVARHSPWHAVVSTAGAVATYIAMLVVCSRAIFPLVVMGSAILTVTGALIVWTNARVRATWVDVRRRENLAHFLPRQVVDRVLRSGGQALAPVQREVTLLFSDVRDFTTMSESLPPREVLEFLDDYFGQMSQIVKGRDGMLNKFIGDGLMAVWNVPDAREDHAVLAVRAALDMRARLAELNAHRAQNGKSPIRIGIGVHTGVVAAGMLGGADQHEYTVIGDAVNLASRIEGLTKSLNSDLLVSERTWELTQGRFTGERVAKETVKGRAEPVVVYSVAGPATAG
jgi:adenylate cyclase